MQTRMVEIFPRKNYTADSTELIDINLIDPISQLLLTYEPDNNPDASEAQGHPIRCIEKIDLVDGSDVLLSLSGAEAHAIDFYHNWIEPPGDIRYLTGNYSKVVAILNFGRFLFDSEFAIDPARHNNLQLKIKIAIAGGGDHSNDGYLTVMAQVFDQKQIAAKGFLMTKEVKQYTLANASHEYTDLPLDYPYKQLFFRAQRYGIKPRYQIDTLKLSEDQDKKIPINGLTLAQIIDNLAARWPKYHEMILSAGSIAAFTRHCVCSDDCYGQSTEWRAVQAGTIASLYSIAGGSFTISASVAGPNQQIFIQGRCPHAVVPLLPDFSNDPADWYDVRNLKSLKLDVKGAADVGTAQTAEIIAQQLRMY